MKSFSSMSKHCESCAFSSKSNHWESEERESASIALFDVIDKFKEGLDVSNRKKANMFGNSGQFGTSYCQYECQEHYPYGHMGSNGQKCKGSIQSGYEQKVGIGEQVTSIAISGGGKQNFESHGEECEGKEEKKCVFNQENSCANSMVNEDHHHDQALSQAQDEQKYSSSGYVHGNGYYEGEDFKRVNGKIKCSEGPNVRNEKFTQHGNGQYSTEAKRQQGWCSSGNFNHGSNMEVRYQPGGVQIGGSQKTLISKEEADFLKRMMSHEKLRSQASWMQNEHVDKEAFMYNVISNMKMQGSKAWNEENFINCFFREKSNLQSRRGRKQQMSCYEQCYGGADNFYGQPMRVERMEEYYRGGPSGRGKWYTTETYTYSRR